LAENKEDKFRPRRYRASLPVQDGDNAILHDCLAAVVCVWFAVELKSASSPPMLGGAQIRLSRLGPGAR
jgi:hypothetical protein